MAESAAEYKASNIKAYDVQGLTLIADALVVCSVASEPQMKAVLNGVKEGMREVGSKPLHTEGSPGSGWHVLDYGAVLFHLFRAEAREYYDLDGLWADAPEIALELDED
jgi:ribosome-associated protein